MAEPKRISVAQAKEKMGSGALLVCIYGQESYDESHLDGAISMADWTSRNAPKETEVCFY